MRHRGLGIVLALVELAAAPVAAARRRGWVEDEVKGRAALPAEAASGQTTPQLIARHLEEDHAVQLETPGVEQALERLRLGDRPREPVEHPAPRRVGLPEALVDEADDDVVGHQRAPVHVPLGFEPQARLLLGRLAEHLTGGHVGNGPLRGEPPGLRALAGAGRPQEDDADAHACTFARFLRKPS